MRDRDHPRDGLHERIVEALGPHPDRDVVHAVSTLLAVEQGLPPQHSQDEHLLSRCIDIQQVMMLAAEPERMWLSRITEQIGADAVLPFMTVLLDMAGLEARHQAMSRGSSPTYAVVVDVSRKLAQLQRFLAACDGRVAFAMSCLRGTETAFAPTDIQDLMKVAQSPAVLVRVLAQIPSGLVVDHDVLARNMAVLRSLK